MEKLYLVALIFGQLKCNEQVVDLLNQGLLLTTRIGALESIPTWDEVFWIYELKLFKSEMRYSL